MNIRTRSSEFPLLDETLSASETLISHSVSCLWCVFLVRCRIVLIQPSAHRTRRTRLRRACRIPGTWRTGLYTWYVSPHPYIYSSNAPPPQQPKPSYQRYLQMTANSHMYGTNTSSTTSPKAVSSTSSWQMTQSDGKQPPHTMVQQSDPSPSTVKRRLRS